jgi:hypothetical protein
VRGTTSYKSLLLSLKYSMKVAVPIQQILIFYSSHPKACGANDACYGSCPDCKRGICAAPTQPNWPVTPTPKVPRPAPKALKPELKPFPSAQDPRPTVPVPKFIRPAPKAFEQIQNQLLQL